MSPEEIDAKFADLPPHLIWGIAREYIHLLVRIRLLDIVADKAYRNGEKGLAQHYIAKCVDELQKAAHRTIGGKAKEVWFPNSVGFFAFDTIEDALRFAQAGHRHWLTALSSDELSVSPQDASRAMMEAKAAAILFVYGERGGTRELANKIAGRLSKAGFRTKRNQGPAGRTVQDWLTDIRKLRSEKDSPLREKLHHAVRLHAFEVDQAYLDTSLTCAEALELIEHDCRVFSRRMIGAEPSGS